MVEMKKAEAKTMFKSKSIKLLKWHQFMALLMRCS